MPKITFSYIFNDSFHRVFEAFKEIKLNIRSSVKDLITNVIFTKGNHFYEENAEFSYYWKNYYKLKIIVENVINEQLFKSYTHKTLNIDKLPIQLKFIFNFFWDKINEQTIFIFVIDVNDEFFTELIKNDFTEEDKLNICKQIEEYLSISLKGLETSYTCTLDGSLNKIRKYILYPNLFFQIISKELIVTTNENEIFLDEKYGLFVKSENSSDLIPLTILNVENLAMSEFYAKVVYNTYKKISFPNIKFTIIFKELGNKKTFFHLSVKPNELVPHEVNRKLFTFWKKRMYEFCNFFEKNTKK